MTMRSSRRVFMLQSAACVGALTTVPASGADAVSTVKLTETDAYAKSMGFRLDTNQVDKVRYPRHDAASQQCNKCQLYSGAAGDAVGPCSFYGGRLVPAGGWCRNFKVKKAAA